ncbi:hypothetical protein EI983_00775 [Roseovarius faecimaris]|uniref:Uncharacterized protein n=1 Tax=Roseovarius faecimaris TaxID=2494550 RepID=A0A6I6ILZ9_9RHOB|nr:hypothetical protein [Roseovarius faecimaris]QGX96891.1 hypothetical protein EI983_00775 [Roseovarius faecimaris]
MSGTQDKIETSVEYAEADVLPRCHEIHSDPDARARCLEERSAALRQEPIARKSPAEWAYERLILYIQNFEETLDNEHEIAMGFTGAEAGVMRIEGMGYFDPDIITFYGSDPTGTKTQQIQHVSQLNVILRALPKQVEEAAPTRIGFRLAQALEQDDAQGD